jgi:hypothetical protein
VPLPDITTSLRGNLRSPRRPAREPLRRPALAARMLALAHHIEAAIEDGRFGSAADVARELGLSRNRVATLLCLTSIAPSIQEQILGLESVDGAEPITERWLFEMLGRQPLWVCQERIWMTRSHRAPRPRRPAADLSTSATANPVRPRRPEIAR